MIEQVKRYRLRCDNCGRIFARPLNGTQALYKGWGQARQCAMEFGWSFAGGTDRCPECRKEYEQLN